MEIAIYKKSIAANRPEIAPDNVEITTDKAEIAADRVEIGTDTVEMDTYMNGIAGFSVQASIAFMETTADTAENGKKPTVSDEWLMGTHSN